MHLPTLFYSFLSTSNKDAIIPSCFETFNKNSIGFSFLEFFFFVNYIINNLIRMKKKIFNSKEGSLNIKSSYFIYFTLNFGIDCSLLNLTMNILQI
jgi:hypothetical protein